MVGHGLVLDSLTERGARQGAPGREGTCWWGVLLSSIPFASPACVWALSKETVSSGAEGEGRGKPAALPVPREPGSSAPLPAEATGSLGTEWGLQGLPCLERQTQS